MNFSFLQSLVFFWCSARLYSTGSASMSQWLVLELCPAVLGLSLATKMVRFTGGFELQLKNLNLFERLVRTENKRNLKRNRRNVLIQEKKQNWNKRSWKRSSKGQEIRYTKLEMSEHLSQFNSKSNIQGVCKSTVQKYFLITSIPKQYMN